MPASEVASGFRLSQLGHARRGLLVRVGVKTVGTASGFRGGDLGRGGEDGSSWKRWCQFHCDSDSANDNDGGNADC